MKKTFARIVIVAISALLIWLVFFSKAGDTPVPATGFYPKISEKKFEYEDAKKKMKIRYPVSSNELINQEIAKYVSDTSEEFKITDDWTCNRPYGNCDDVIMTLDVQYSIITAKNLASYHFIGDEYTGGDGTDLGDRIFNFDIQTGQKLMAEDIFIDGYFTELQFRVREALRSGKGMAGSHPVTDLLFEEIDTGISQPYHLLDFYISDKTITFVIPRGQVAKKSIGPITLKFDRSKFNDLFRKDW